MAAADVKFAQNYIIVEAVTRTSGLDFEALIVIITNTLIKFILIILIKIDLIRPCVSSD